MLLTLNMRRGKRILEQNPLSAGPKSPLSWPVSIRRYSSSRTIRGDHRGRLAVGLRGARRMISEIGSTQSIHCGRYLPSELPILANTTVSMLFVSMMGAGDDYAASNDLPNAYEMYSRRVNHPSDTTSVQKASSVVPLLTPTATPTLTLTPGPTAPPPSATATATPRPLRNIPRPDHLKSENPDPLGIYVMDPDGSNREGIWAHSSRYE